jgi:hypothetical protein
MRRYFDHFVSPKVEALYMLRSLEVQRFARKPYKRNLKQDYAELSLNRLVILFAKHRVSTSLLSTIYNLNYGLVLWMTFTSLKSQHSTVETY